MYYKFRDLRNFKYLIDILVEQRLYSGSFRELNDNMEGQFFCNAFTGIERYRLNPRKQEHISICSFSLCYKNHVMWSHYADGHRGIAIGFEVDNVETAIEKVDYNGLARFDDFPSKFVDVKSVFLNKAEVFSYENEYRIITDKQNFVKIKIKEILFGAETSEENKRIISKIAKLVDSEIVLDTYYG